MSEMNNLIFSENSTLFNILDELQVPELSANLRQVKEEIAVTNDQLTQLGRVVDQNKIYLDTQIVTLNTRVDNQESEIVQIRSTTESLSVSVSSLSNQVDTLTSSVANLTATVSNFIVSTTNNFRLLDDQIAALTSRTTAVETGIAQITPRLDAITGLPGVITGQVRYAMWNQQRDNPWLRTLILNINFGVRPRIGQWYSCTIDGVQQWIQFADQQLALIRDEVRDIAINYGVRNVYVTSNVSQGPWIRSQVNLSLKN